MGDSYHPSRYRDDRYDRYSPPRRNDYYDGYRSERPRDEYRDSGFSFRGAAGDRDPRPDTYRPPRGDFTFQSTGPQAPRFPPASREQQAPSRPRQDSRRGRGGGRGGRGFGRGGRFIPKPAHKRAILGFTEGADAPEEMLGPSEHAKFLEMESSDEDSDEADEAENGDQPRKRAKVSDDADQPDRPQWSNPDPYSVLPPTDVVNTAKKDIVQTIRKRKAEVAASNDATNSIKENADFISFNFDEPESEGEVDSSEGDDNDFVAAPPAQAAVDLPPPPPPQDLVMPTDEELMQTYTGSSTSKRKRGFEQTLSSSAGAIVEEWLPDGSDTTPWLNADTEFQSNVGLQLHTEVMDFFDYVAPRSYERSARVDLINRIERVVRMAPAGQDVEIKSFGSFASDLYLPTADMDLVAVSRHYMSGGRPMFCQSSSKMHKLAALLKNYRVAKDDMVTVISKAKVPILKFVDALTGIKVDISFENDSGINALPTFRDWKERYPRMPTLVVLIKQFLTMRGLNEVFLGGIGGFTIICLVTSMMQHMEPEKLSGDDCSYGELLQNFFDLYGNKFDIQNTGIMMNPGRYFRKGVDPVYCKINPNTLTIIDPNRRENDISGGSRQIDKVFKCFRGAHNEIQRRLNDVRTGKSKSNSILGCIIGGNYSSFDAQRQLLRSLDRGSQSQSSSTAAPPPPAPARALPPQYQPGYYNYPQYPEPPQSYGPSNHHLPNRPAPVAQYPAHYHSLPPPPPPPQSEYAYAPYGATAAGDWSEGQQNYDVTGNKTNRTQKRAAEKAKKQAAQQAAKEATVTAKSDSTKPTKRKKPKKSKAQKNAQKEGVGATSSSLKDPTAATPKPKKKKNKNNPVATEPKPNGKQLKPQSGKAERKPLRERKVAARKTKQKGAAAHSNGG
ncbi:putative PAP/25A-associated, polymerase, nucleotidyl transferase domain, nucleotidyltransferase Trf4 [Septoria linicola]|nr:putative PAP/25A-associated, polymerase, nucleotidyl transferase domain, nucleotidyltransferase Trf4 [Septoria linicola]